MYLRTIIVLFLSLLLITCSNRDKTKKNEITVFCASSLTKPVEEIKSRWEKDHDQRIVLNFASTGTLSRQIEYGAEADIFLSANHEWMDYVQEIIQISSEPITLAINRLVVIAPTVSSLDSMNFQQLLETMTHSKHKIAIGDPGHVPVGKYTKSALDNLNVYKDMGSKFILAKDARNALRLVELGEAQYGFVYFTDAISSTLVRTVAQVPDTTYDEIAYEALLLSSNKTNARLFFDYLTSQESRKIWDQHGFIF